MAKGDFCQVKECKNVIKTWGKICQMHRTRWHRHRDFNYISPNWNNIKGGGYNNYGYWRVTKNGKRVLEHRYVMEQHLNRPLTKSEKIHHINGIRNDNRLENLELISNQSEHIHKYHPHIWRKRKVNNPYI